MAISARRGFFPLGHRALSRRLEDVGFRYGVIERLRGFFQRQPGAGPVHGFTGEFAEIHFYIRRHNHQVRLTHLLGSDSVTGAYRSPGFHLDPPAAFFRFGLDGLGRHKGVGNAGGARRHRDHPFRAGRRHRAGGRRCGSGGLIRCALRAGALQKGVWIDGGVFRRTLESGFTVERGIAGPLSHQHPEFRIRVVIDQLQIVFVCRISQQRAQQMAAGLA